MHVSDSAFADRKACPMATTSSNLKALNKTIPTRLTARLPWFAASVRDIRMLRIEELNDLMPVVQRIAGLANEGE